MMGLNISRKSVLTLLVLALVSVSNINAATNYTEIDITKTGGSGQALKAAAEKFCGASLSVDELTRRRALAETAQTDFINPEILESLKKNDGKRNRALICQKVRNLVLMDTCQLQASIKQNLKCEITLFTKVIASRIDGANRSCGGVDEKLFFTITGLNEPKPLQPQEKCGPKPKSKDVFTTKFRDVDITKTPGFGDAILKEAERVCGTNLSFGELNHRSNTGFAIEFKVFNPKIKEAGTDLPLVKALNCQRIKNKIMYRTCKIGALGKLNKETFQIQENTIIRQKDIDLSKKVCDKVDTTKLLDVVEPPVGGNSTSNGSPAKPSKGLSASTKNAADHISPISSVAFVALLVCLLT